VKNDVYRDEVLERKIKNALTIINASDQKVADLIGRTAAAISLRRKNVPKEYSLLKLGYVAHEMGIKSTEDLVTRLLVGGQLVL